VRPGLSLGLGAITVAVFAVATVNLYQAGQLPFAGLIAVLTALRAGWWVREALKFRRWAARRPDRTPDQ
jgi:hypothetical protein